MMATPYKNDYWDSVERFNYKAFTVAPPKFPYLPIVDSMDVEHRIEDKLKVVETKLNLLLEDRDIYKKVNGILLPSWKEYE